MSSFRKKHGRKLISVLALGIESAGSNNIGLLGSFFGIVLTLRVCVCDIGLKGCNRDFTKQKLVPTLDLSYRYHPHETTYRYDIGQYNPYRKPPPTVSTLL